MEVNNKGLFRKIGEDTVSRVIATVIATLIIAGGTAVWLMFTGYLRPERKDGKNPTDPPQETYQEPEIIAEKIIDEGGLPYLKKLTLLDQNIYIGYFYNDIIIGGKNIAKLKIAARTSDGGNAEPRIDQASRELKYHAWDKPTIEFEYRNTLYSIEISGEIFAYRYRLKRVPTSTMDLEAINLN